MHDDLIQVRTGDAARGGGPTGRHRLPARSRACRRGAGRRPGRAAGAGSGLGRHDGTGRAGIGGTRLARRGRRPGRADRRRATGRRRRLRHRRRPGRDPAQRRTVSHDDRVRTTLVGRSGGLARGRLRLAAHGRADRPAHHRADRHRRDVAGRLVRSGRAGGRPAAAPARRRVDREPPGVHRDRAGPRRVRGPTEPGQGDARRHRRLGRESWRAGRPARHGLARPGGAPGSDGSTTTAAVEIAAGIRTALELATAADRDAARRLADLAACAGSGWAVAPPAGPPAPGTDPAAVRTWWAGLTPAQRRWLVGHEPALIGRLDGVPVRDRDQANRLLLGQRRAALLAERAVLLAGPFSPVVPAMVARLDRTLAGLDVLGDRLATETGPRAYLLGLDPAGDGRAVVAIGDPDQADNVLTYVPGMTSDLPSIGGELGRAERMAARCAALEPAGQTAVVLWLDYDAPDFRRRGARRRPGPRRRAGAAQLPGRAAGHARGRTGPADGARPQLRLAGGRRDRTRPRARRRPGGLRRLTRGRRRPGRRPRPAGREGLVQHRQR